MLFVDVFINYSNKSQRISLWINIYKLCYKFDNHMYIYCSDLICYLIYIDIGVVISMISDKNGEGYALILDASTFEEVARAKFPYGLPYGLHGAWVPNK